MLLRRHNRVDVDEPQLNGEPIKVDPKTEALNEEPDLKNDKIVAKNETKNL